MKIKGFPSIKCPVCGSWLCNARDITVKKGTAAQPIDNQEALLSESLNAEYIIKCSKCKSFVALIKEKTEQSVEKSTA